MPNYQVDVIIRYNDNTGQTTSLPIEANSIGEVAKKAFEQVLYPPTPQMENIKQMMIVAINEYNPNNVYKFRFISSTMPFKADNTTDGETQVYDFVIQADSANNNKREAILLGIAEVQGMIVTDAYPYVNMTEIL